MTRHASCDRDPWAPTREQMRVDALLDELYDLTDQLDGVILNLIDNARLRPPYVPVKAVPLAGGIEAIARELKRLGRTRLAEKYRRGFYRRRFRELAR
ncbi:MAG: hypothetical protein WC655_19260 [Candidatus Hydrogenedentales bacterium]